MTPLQCASTKTSGTQAARLLLSHGASLEQANSPHLVTPLYLTLLKGPSELSDLLLAHGASLDRYTTFGSLYSDKLATVIPEDHQLASKQFWHDQCHVDLLGQTPLSTFIATTDVTSLNANLKESRDLFIPNDYGFLPVTAFWEASPTMQAYVLNSAIDLTLYHPAFGGVFQVLINDVWLSFLQRLLRRVGHTQSRRLLNLKPKYRHTPLYYACGGGQIKVAKLLITHGADLNLHGGLFGSALMAATTYGRFDMVKMLVWAGATIFYYSPELGRAVSAFDAAKFFPEIQRWMLVERWTERRVLGS